MLQYIDDDGEMLVGQIDDSNQKSLEVNIIIIPAVWLTDWLLNCFVKEPNISIYFFFPPITHQSGCC